MAESIAAPPLARSRTFPATPAHVRDARRYLAGILGCRPRADDAVLCLGELAANAVLHSRSREGGFFTVTAQVTGEGVRVEVRDQGGPWEPPSPAGGRPGPGPLLQQGRGLLMVGGLASAWGCDGGSDTGWTVWFTMGSLMAAASDSAPPEPGRAALHA